MAFRTLRITSGPAAGQSIEIEKELVIGREGADLTIEDSELSRRHASLRPVERGVEIEDLGSLNGTFVNGQRISTAVTLAAAGTLKLGITQATVEVSLPQTTRIAGTPGEPAAAPDATVARSIPDAQDLTAEKPVADPDATVQRPTAKPEVTAQRPQADATAEKPVAGPDVTVQRPAAKPDVTVQRPTEGPDLTVQRPVEAAGPPAGGEPPAVPPTPSHEGGGGSRGPKLSLIVGGLVVVLALIVAAIVLASGGGEESKTRKLSLTLDVGTATAEDKRLSELPPGKKAIRWNLFGEARGQPFGTGNVKAVVTLHPAGPPPGAPAAGKRAAAAKPPADKPKPATVTSRFVIRFARGTVIAAERVESRKQGGGLEITGTGRILSGTGDFEGAKGTFKVAGSRPRFDESAERVEWRGSVEY